MTRIFASLAVFSLLLMFANMAVGLAGGDYNQMSRRLRAASAKRTAEVPSVTPLQREQLDAEYLAVREEFLTYKQHATLHMLLGVLASLVTILVHCIAVTYFIGTGRWCKEVVETYELDPQFVARSSRLKRTTFPWSLLGMLTVLAIVMLGAASDPGTLLDATQSWVPVHLWASMGGTMLIAFCLVKQHLGIGRNLVIINEIMAQVQAARSDVEDAAPPNGQSR